VLLLVLLLLELALLLQLPLLLLLLLAVRLVDRPGVAVLLLTVGGELRLDDRAVPRVLQRLLVAGRVHEVEIVVPREHHRLVVRRERGPPRRSRRGHVVF